MNASLPGPGDQFGRYLIDSEIAKGGFSVVLRAQRDDGTPVAIKILAPQDPTIKYSNNLKERFAREARLLTQIRSPFTVQLFEYGLDERTGLLYMAFELVEGLSLFQMIKNEGPQDAYRMLAILKQCCMGLARAHDVGIIHRDLKPNNIMLFADGVGGDRVKVIDFGIAKMLGEAGQDLTTVGTIVGTPRYMSPEQIRCQDLTPASDIFSLGLCMVELLTAKKAVWGNSRTDIITRQLDTRIPVPVPDNLPGTVFDIVFRMVSKVPSDRFQSVNDILTRIETFHQMSAEERAGDTVYQTVDDDALQSMLTDLSKPPDDATMLSSIRIDALPEFAQVASPIDETVMAAPVDLDQTIASGFHPHMPRNPDPVASGQHSLVRDRRRRDSAQHLPHVPDDSQNFVSHTPQPFSQTTPSSQRIQENAFSNDPDHAIEFRTDTAHPQTNASTPIIASVFLPGSGHLIAGFKPKAALFLAAWFMFAALSAMFIFGSGKSAFDYVLGFITTLVVIVVTLTAVVDLWLTMRAAKRRPVEPLEFLPEISDVLERLK